MQPVCRGIPEDESATILNRRKREIVDVKTTNERVINGDKGIVSYGPIAVKLENDKEEESVGKGTYEMVYEELEKDQGKLYHLP